MNKKMDYKKIVESIGNSLSNLHEKSKNEYINTLCNDEESFPTEFQQICENAAKIVKNYEFKEGHNEHPFLELNEELANNIGLDKITIVAYPEYEFSIKESNFIYNYKGNDLMIDVYDCVDKDSNEIYEDVMQELYNFFRDASWVMEGVEVYNEKINEMKEFRDLFRL